MDKVGELALSICIWMVSDERRHQAGIPSAWRSTVETPPTLSVKETYSKYTAQCFGWQVSLIVFRVNEVFSGRCEHNN